MKVTRLLIPTSSTLNTIRNRKTGLLPIRDCRFRHRSGRQRASIILVHVILHFFNFFLQCNKTNDIYVYCYLVVETYLL